MIHVGGSPSPPSRRNVVGRYGEDLACRHLSGLGYAIVARNWRCPAGEVDIIAVDGNCLVVCEVKTRTSAAFGTPQEAVTWRKARRLRQLSSLWLAERTSSETERFDEVRVDVVAVSLPKRGAAVLDHLRGVC